MTEYEINKAVAEKLGIKVYNRHPEMLFTATVHRGEYDFTKFDPCNNAQQAWEIMLANDIGITQCLRGDDYCAYRGLWGEGENFDPDNLTCNCFYVTNEKPFVAAMLCFLEI